MIGGMWSDKDIKARYGFSRHLNEKGRSMETTFTIRRAADGRSHFARVTVDLLNHADTPQNTLDAPLAWVVAANEGVRFAMAVMKSEYHVRIIEVLGTDADTGEDTVFAAAAMSTFQASGDLDRDVYFVNNRWYVA